MQERHDRPTEELGALPAADGCSCRAVQRLPRASAEIGMGRVNWIKHGIVDTAFHRDTVPTGTVF